MLRRSRNPDFGKRQTAGSTNATSSKGKTLRQGNVEDESEDELQSYLTGIKKKVERSASIKESDIDWLKLMAESEDDDTSSININNDNGLSNNNNLFLKSSTVDTARMDDREHQSKKDSEVTKSPGIEDRDIAGKDNKVTKSSIASKGNREGNRVTKSKVSDSKDIVSKQASLKVSTYKPESKRDVSDEDVPSISDTSTNSSLSAEMADQLGPVESDGSPTSVSIASSKATNNLLQLGVEKSGEDTSSMKTNFKKNLFSIDQLDAVESEPSSIAESINILPSGRTSGMQKSFKSEKCDQTTDTSESEDAESVDESLSVATLDYSGHSDSVKDSISDRHTNSATSQEVTNYSDDDYSEEFTESSDTGTEEERSSSSGAEEHTKWSTADACVQTSLIDLETARVNFPFTYPKITVGTQYGKEYLQPSPIMLPPDALEAMTAYSPSALALNDMMRLQLQLTQQLVNNSRQLVARFSSALTPNYHYTTLESTKQFIAENKPRILSFSEAKKKVSRRNR